VGRKQYETRQDLVAENAIRNAFSSTYRLDSYKLSASKADSSVDCLFLQDRKLYAVGEIKDRRGWKPEYGTIILSICKVKALQEWSRLFNIAALFIVRLPDGIWWVRIPQHIVWEVGVHGRKDRNDPADQELCFRIPKEEFVCATPFQER